jgi:PKD domain
VFSDTTRGCVTVVEPVVAAKPRAAAPKQAHGRSKKPGPSPEVLARQAFDRAVALAGQPRLGIAPAGVGLTGLESYFWLAESPRPISATARAGGLSVTAEASPLKYLWNFGDGSNVVTSDPGRPWTKERPGSIAHLYETRGSYGVSVEVAWQARWRIDNGAWQPLGFFSTSDGLAYPVRQIQSRLVPTH